MLEIPNSKDIIEVNLGVQIKNDKPVIEIRKYITDPDQIKMVISLAWHDQPLVVYPVIKHKVRALADLQEVGILALNKENQNYEFLI